MIRGAARRRPRHRDRGPAALLDGEPDIKVAPDHRRHGSRQLASSTSDVVVLDLELTSIKGTESSPRSRDRTTPPKVLVLTR